MREQLGFRFDLKVNIISDEMNQQGQIEYSFGVNKIPTKQEVDKVLIECLNTFDKAIGAGDSRLVNMGDFGIAEPSSMRYIIE